MIIIIIIITTIITIKFATPYEQYVGWDNNINFIFIATWSQTRRNIRVAANMFKTCLDHENLGFTFPILVEKKETLDGFRGSAGATTQDLGPTAFHEDSVVSAPGSSAGSVPHMDIISVHRDIVGYCGNPWGI